MVKDADAVGRILAGPCLLRLTTMSCNGLRSGCRRLALGKLLYCMKVGVRVSTESHMRLVDLKRVRIPEDGRDAPQSTFPVPLSETVKALGALLDQFLALYDNFNMILRRAQQRQAILAKVARFR